MYFNDVNIGYYIVLAIIGLFVGELVSWLDKRLPEYKKVFSKEAFKEYKANFNPNYILMILGLILLTTLVTRKQIKNLFTSSVRVTLKGGAN